MKNRVALLEAKIVLLRSLFQPLRNLFGVKKRLHVLSNCIFLLYPFILQAQEGVIDTSVVRASANWPAIGNIQLSRNGRFVQYNVSNRPAGSQTLVIQSTEGAWKKELVDATSADMTADSRWLVFRQNDSLCALSLGGEEMLVLVGISHYEVLQKNGASWLVYVSKEKVLVMRELGNNREQRWPGCANFWLDSEQKKLLWASEKGLSQQTSYSLQWLDLDNGVIHPLFSEAMQEGLDIILVPSGHTLLYTTLQITGTDSAYRLHWCNLEHGTETEIYTSRAKPGPTQLDREGRQMLFLGRDTVWYYRDGMDQVKAAITPNAPGLDHNSQISNPSFTQDGKRILFTVTERAISDTEHNGVQVDVWHYRDKVLASAQSLSENFWKYITIVWNIDNGAGRITRIDQEEEQGLSYNNSSRYVLMQKQVPHMEWWQMPKALPVYLVSLEDGSRRPLAIDTRYFDPVLTLSPHEDYVVYYDPVRDGYFSYNTADGKKLELTKGLGVSWRDIERYRYYNAPNPFFRVNPCPRGIAVWVDGGASILVYDSYDIWKLDPTGHRPPENMTGGYGRMQHIVFTLTGGNTNNLQNLSNGGQLTLNAFKLSTRESGFYRASKGKTPELLAFGPYSWGLPAKARDADVWSVCRISPSEGFHLYALREGEAPMLLQSIQPQKDYSWYRSEVVSWKLPNGENCQGVLYTPEDLDTTRKYPLLFNYYEICTLDPYKFIKPSLAAACNINVPYFVSRGYLVFMPDIHYRMGHPGASALASIVSAAQYLSKRPYVDSRRMGLAGHSWGGYETNYVVTHSHLFAAAAEGAGLSDFIASYDALSGADGHGIGESRQSMHEGYQTRMGVTLWQRPDLYAENSPILRADKVTTPLLILHNKLDEAVPWSQGVELFTALRRLGRRAWLLQYDGEDHQLTNPSNILDYTIRITQFFDHYLKGAPAPKWMTEGVPMSRKGIDSGLELDTTGIEP